MKTFVITDQHGRVLREQVADFAHVALREAKEQLGPMLALHAKTAIVKTEWERERRERAWLMKARVEE